MKRFIYFSISIFIWTSVRAQISTHEMPVSFTVFGNFVHGIDRSIDKKCMPKLDMESINMEDKEDQRYDIPPRFGYSHIVDYNLNNSGTWFTLPKGKLWQLVISCPDALSINLLYDKFWIPEGGKLFVYTTDKKQVIGAFTSKNNKGDKKNIQGFATGLLYGNEITIEYYQPNEVEDDAIISISNVVHGYRYLCVVEKSLNGSGSCQVNVNCSEGDNWQNEKRAVALILVNGNRFCTGSLVMTTSKDYQPLLLTADHCLGGWANEEYAGIAGFKYDAINSPNLNHWSFYWNYEAPGCSNVAYEPNKESTTGAIIKSNNSSSDFALLQLTENPKEIATPYYLGWDVSGNSGSGGVCIHHPNGDVKKISTYLISPASSNYASYNNDNNGKHWRVNWAQTLNGYGTTEGGSSGSPLLNSNHRVIGQLHGGDSNCSNQTGADWYGKLSVSWTGNGSGDIRRRLDHWLDPSGTNLQSINGSYPISFSGPYFICNSTSALYTISGIPSNYTISWSLTNGFGPVTPTLQISGKNCTINNNLSKSYLGTLNALVYYNGALIKTFSQQIVAYGGFYGTYGSGNVFSPTSPVWVTKGSPVTLKSPNFVNKNISYSNTTPAGWQYNSSSGEITVTYPTGSSTSPIVISVQNNTYVSNCDNNYQILVMPNSVLSTYYMKVNTNSGKLEVSLQTLFSRDESLKSMEDVFQRSDDNVDIPWMLEVYNATTGEKVVDEKVTDNSITIDTTGWKSGVYVVKAVVGGEVLSEKVIIK